MMYLQNPFTSVYHFEDMDFNGAFSEGEKLFSYQSHGTVLPIVVLPRPLQSVLLFYRCSDTEWVLGVPMMGFTLAKWKYRKAVALPIVLVLISVSDLASKNKFLCEVMMCNKKNTNISSTGMEILGTYSTMFSKKGYVTSCLLSYTLNPSEKGSALKGKNLLQRSKFFPFKVDPCWQGRQKHFDKVASPLGVNFLK